MDTYVFIGTFLDHFDTERLPGAPIAHDEWRRGRNRIQLRWFGYDCGHEQILQIDDSTCSSRLLAWRDTPGEIRREYE